MSKRQDALIAEQKTYLDMVTAREPYRAVTASDRINAGVELAAMRQRVAELERERDAARSGHDYAVSESASRTAYITELLNRVAELEAAQAVVTPRKCEHCHKAAEKMREAAARMAECAPLSFYDTRTQREIAKAIRALPLPTCGDCNPLAPEMVSYCSSCGHPSTDHDSDGIHPCGQCDCAGYTPKVSLFK